MSKTINSTIQLDVNLRKGLKTFDVYKAGEELPFYPAHNYVPLNMDWMIIEDHRPRAGKEMDKYVNGSEWSSVSHLNEVLSNVANVSIEFGDGTVTVRLSEPALKETEAKFVMLVRSYIKYAPPGTDEATFSWKSQPYRDQNGSVYYTYVNIYQYEVYARRFNVSKELWYTECNELNQGDCYGK